MSREQHEKIKGLLEEAQDVLVGYQQDMANGNPLQMGNFDSVVRDLCEQIKLLPPAEAAMYESSLQSLSKALGALSGLLVERQAELGDNIHKLDIGQKAHSAYKKNDNENS